MPGVVRLYPVPSPSRSDSEGSRFPLSREGREDRRNMLRPYTKNLPLSGDHRGPEPDRLPGMDYREILAGQDFAVRDSNARVHHVAAGGHVAGVGGHVVDGDCTAGNG